MTYRFADCELDDERWELRRAGELVKVEPKVFDLLLFLLKNRERVVTKHELLEAIWPKQFVSESALTSCIKSARRAVGDDGDQQSVIKTIHRRGYAFLAAVETAAVTVPPQPAATPPPRASSYVGRRALLVEIDALIGCVSGGTGHVVLLAGEPGIGKTRTLEEIGSMARARGFGVLRGVCHDDSATPPFWLWVQILRDLVAGRDAATLRAELGTAATAVAHLVPALREKLPDLAPAPSLDGKTGRFHLFDSVSAWLRKVATRSPLVVLLDDLHWADPGSLMLLRFVARTLPQTSCLVAAAYRDMELGRAHPLQKLLGELASLSSVRRFSLRGLAEEETEQLACSTAERALPRSLIGVIQRETEGNPFFVLEIVRLLSADDFLDMSAGSMMKLSIPQSIRDVIGRRIDHLSPTCSTILSFASVLGHKFQIPVLQEMLDRAREKLSADQLLDGLEEAGAARLISAESGAGTCSFSHVLIPDTLYEELSVARRARLHRHAGEAIEHLYARTLDERAGELAHHFVAAAAAGTAEKGVVYSLRAGRIAFETLAYERAQLHYNEALRVLDVYGARIADGEKYRCQALLGIAETLQRSSDSRWTDFAERATTLARVIGDTELFARAVLVHAGTYEEPGSVNRKRNQLLEEALAALGEEHSALRANLLARLGFALRYDPAAAERRDELTARAVKIADAIDDRFTLLHALHMRLISTWNPDNIEERCSIADRMTQLGGSTTIPAPTHGVRIWIALEIGSLAMLDRELEEYGRTVARYPLPDLVYQFEFYRAMRLLLEGRITEAEERCLAAFAASEPCEQMLPSQTFALQMFAIRREQGRLADLEAGSYTFVQRHPKNLAWRVGFALLLMELGRKEEVKDHFEDLIVRHPPDSLPRDLFWISLLTNLAELAAYVQNRVLADKLARLLTPYANKMAVDGVGTFCRAPVARYVGLLNACLERWDAALSHFAVALERADAMRSPVMRAHAEHDLASALIRRGRRSDRERAAGVINRASATASALGLVRLSDKLAALRKL